MGEVVNLNVVSRQRLDPPTIMSIPLLRELRRHIDELPTGSGFVHLRDAETGTAVSVYVQNSEPVRWVANGPSTETEAFQQACRFEGELRRLLRLYR